jgi:hypothetical protein
MSRLGRVQTLGRNPRVPQNLSFWTTKADDRLVWKPRRGTRDKALLLRWSSALPGEDALKEKRGRCVARMRRTEVWPICTAVAVATRRPRYHHE